MFGVKASKSKSPKGRGAFGSRKCNGVSGRCSGQSVRSSKYNACESCDHKRKMLSRNFGLPQVSKMRRHPVISSSNCVMRCSCKVCAALMSDIAGFKKHRDIEMAAVSWTMESGDIVA